MWGEPGFIRWPAGTAHNVKTKQNPSTFNKYLCTQCYIHVLYSSTQEWVWWLNMKLCLCYCSQMHGGCGEEILRNTHKLPFSLLDLLQSSKAIKGTHTVIGQVQPPTLQTKPSCCFWRPRYRYLQNESTTKQNAPASAQKWLVAPVNFRWNQKRSFMQVSKHRTTGGREQT